jgi:hypothetical protein
LQSINGLLEDANTALDTATNGYETLNKLIGVGKALLTGIGFLGL